MVNVPWCHSCNRPDGICVCPDTPVIKENKKEKTNRKV